MNDKLDLSVAEATSDDGFIASGSMRHGPRDAATRTAIQLAVVLSVLAHIALMMGLPQVRLPSFEKPAWGDGPTSLSVNLVPPSLPVPSAPPTALRVPPSSTPRAPPQEAARAQPRPPAAASERPVPNISPSPPGVATAIVPPAQTYSGGDLSSYIEARRRARADAATSRGNDSNPAPTADDKERGDRVVSANLGAQRAPAFGYDPSRKGGAFQLQRVGYNDAELIFYGWNKELRRNMAQLIEVQRGGNSDIRIAVVRRIIEVIRDFERGDFLWESARQGRTLTLSAHPRDNSALEEFMMHEFFGGPRLAQ